MKWINPSKTPPTIPGHYWGVVVIIYPVAIVVKWDGKRWHAPNMGDNFQPFYYGDEPLPEPPPLDDVRQDVQRTVDKLTRRR